MAVTVRCSGVRTERFGFDSQPVFGAIVSGAHDGTIGLRITPLTAEPVSRADLSKEVGVYG